MPVSDKHAPPRPNPPLARSPLSRRSSVTSCRRPLPPVTRRRGVGAARGHGRSSGPSSCPFLFSPRPPRNRTLTRVAAPSALCSPSSCPHSPAEPRAVGRVLPHHHDAAAADPVRLLPRAQDDDDHRPAHGRLLPCLRLRGCAAPRQSQNVRMALGRCTCPVQRGGLQYKARPSRLTSTSLRRISAASVPPKCSRLAAASPLFHRALVPTSSRRNRRNECNRRSGVLPRRSAAPHHGGVHHHLVRADWAAGDYNLDPGPLVTAVVDMTDVTCDRRDRREQRVAGV